MENNEILEIVIFLHETKSIHGTKISVVWIIPF